MAQQEQQSAPLPNPYAEFHKAVQEKLKALGYYEGPVNGEIGPVTQAALAQFQLQHVLPATGMPDEATVAALGVEEGMPGTEAQASAVGATAEPAQPEQPTTQ